MFIFLSSSQYGNSDGGGTLLIGGASLPALQHAVEQKVESFGREYSTQTSSIAVRSESAMTNERVTATLSSFFAGIALVVAGFGLFGLMIYSIAMRTREIGIRMAMGSQRANIFALILREALQLTLMGVALGIPAAIVASRTFASMLFELSYHDPKTLAAASLTLILAGLIAGLLPALRAMKIEPIAALRYE
jgi:ABC-type antimicrobial peptide transport system permease subunit